MKYQIQAGSLYSVENGQTYRKLAFLQMPFYTNQQTVLSPDGRVVLLVQVRERSTHGTHRRDYVMMDCNEQIVITGTPERSQNNNVDMNQEMTVPVSRVDTIRMQKNHLVYYLRMLNSQNYFMEDSNGQIILRIIHNGISGGWAVEAKDKMEPAIMMGIFLFSRYLDKENEFVVL